MFFLIKNVEKPKLLIFQKQFRPATLVITDASDYAIGAVLSQDHGKGEQPIAYESRKLSKAELNYPIHEKELLAIVHAIKLWQQYLEGQSFTVVTDHASLEYIKSQHTLSRRQARWLEVLQSATFDVRYKPGKTNVVADALSRRAYVTNMSTTSFELLEDVTLKHFYKEDKYFVSI